MNSGPSPSDPMVEAGAATQGRSNTPLPTKKSERCSNVSAAEGREKALRSKRSRLVPDPPCSASKGSARLKSVVGASRRAFRSALVSAHPDGGCKDHQKGYAPTHFFHLFKQESGRRTGPIDLVRACDYSKTAPGLSRLSEPSTVMSVASMAATMRSNTRVCATSPSIAPWTTALPSLLPKPIIWS